MRRFCTSASYIFYLGEDYIRFVVCFVEGTPIVEIYSGSNLIYYKPLTADEAKTESDLDLIQLIVKSMQSNKNRWFDNQKCTWLTMNFGEMRYKERNTIYELPSGDKVVKVIVIEDSKKHAKLHILDEVNEGKLNIEFDIKEGDNILRACADYLAVLNKVVGIFKDNESEIFRGTLVKQMYID